MSIIIIKTAAHVRFQNAGRSDGLKYRETKKQLHAYLPITDLPFVVGSVQGAYSSLSRKLTGTVRRFEADHGCD